MPPESRLYEIQLGVYATQEDVQALADGCARLLDSRPWPHRLSVAGQGQTTEPGGTPLAEFYDDLPEEWQYGHGGADPGTREIHEIRVGVLASRQQMDILRDELSRVACPDPDHASPCPTPWASGYTEAEGEYLEQRYGDLRESVNT
ncbi:hypothetical protein [Streptomyces spiramyceticus]|uniref:hypothetical protein n=1 Tax=Streptomyces spiramyceticus TaxID=299717 RepID=UPI00237AC0BC|nr:hypothetical protein [Streptomyces spiramyceticus]